MPQKPEDLSQSIRISQRLPDLIDRLFELADGVKVVDDEGEPAFRRPPDRLAIEYLIDRVLGRPIASAIKPNTEVGSVEIVRLILPENGRDSNLNPQTANKPSPKGASTKPLKSKPKTKKTNSFERVPRQKASRINNKNGNPIESDQ